jgi:hypothetical protein
VGASPNRQRRQETPSRARDVPKQEPSRHRAAMIALAVAALTMTILGAMLQPIWAVRPVSQTQSAKAPQLLVSPRRPIGLR